ncbi:THUMP domain-containing protein 2 [Planoprotostelium fungivorum]|uniref:THUMP domain-containing protein 2 n=1 Tax=Planoprotostelium fungivorum TaxID=1890364 RepID=A0A2P6N4M5_9EUKA|nr:THUMP domain-containing protein 2 [Planoprotostelium fungivorum]
MVVASFLVTCGQGLERIIVGEGIESMFLNVNNLAQGRLSFVVPQVDVIIVASLTTTDNEALLWDSSALNKMVNEAVEESLRFIQKWSMEKFSDIEEAFESCRRALAPQNCPSPVRFRVSCKLSGHRMERHSHQSVSTSIARGVTEASQHKWKSNVKEYEMELYVNLTDRSTLLAFPLPRRDKSSSFGGPVESDNHNFTLKDYFLVSGMRSSLAWAMVKLLGVRHTETICDPMCGKGTLLIEMCSKYKSNAYIGIDVSREQLEKASENVLHLTKYQAQANISLFYANSTNLPLRDDSIDAFISDIPFGQRFGSYEDCKRIYPLLLEEMFRVGTSTCKAVILTSQNQLLRWLLNRKYKEQLWRIASDIPVQLGTTKSTIFVLETMKGEISTSKQMYKYNAQEITSILKENTRKGSC